MKPPPSARSQPRPDIEWVEPPPSARFQPRPDIEWVEPPPSARSQPRPDIEWVEPPPSTAPSDARHDDGVTTEPAERAPRFPGDDTTPPGDYADQLIPSTDVETGEPLPEAPRPDMDPHDPFAAPPPDPALEVQSEPPAEQVRRQTNTQTLRQALGGQPVSHPDQLPAEPKDPVNRAEPGFWQRLTTGGPLYAVWPGMVADPAEMETGAPTEEPRTLPINPVTGQPVSHDYIPRNRDLDLETEMQARAALDAYTDALPHVGPEQAQRLQQASSHLRRALAGLEPLDESWMPADRTRLLPYQYAAGARAAFGEGKVPDDPGQIDEIAQHLDRLTNRMIESVDSAEAAERLRPLVEQNTALQRHLAEQRIAAYQGQGEDDITALARGSARGWIQFKQAALAAASAVPGPQQEYLADWAEEEHERLKGFEFGPPAERLGHSGRIAFTTGQMLPQLLTSVAGGKGAGQLAKAAGLGTKGQAAASFFGWATPAATLEASSQYYQTRDQLLDRGVEPEKAERAGLVDGLTHGVVSIVLERLPFDELGAPAKAQVRRLVGSRARQVMEKTFGQTTAKTLSGGLREYGTERMQEAHQSVLEGLRGDSDFLRWLGEGDEEAGRREFEKSIALIGAGLAGGATGLAQGATMDAQTRALRDRITRQRDVLTRAGVTRRQARQAAQTVREAAQQPAESPETAAEAAEGAFGSEVVPGDEATEARRSEQAAALERVEQARRTLRRVGDAAELRSLEDHPALRGASVRTVDRDGELVEEVRLPDGRRLDVRLTDQQTIQQLREQSPEAEAESIVSAMQEAGDPAAPADAEAFLALPAEQQAELRRQYGAAGYFELADPATGETAIGPAGTIFLARGIGDPTVMTEELVHGLERLGLLTPAQVRDLAETVNPGSTKPAEDAARAVYQYRSPGQRFYLPPRLGVAVDRVVGFFQELGDRVFRGRDAPPSARTVRHRIQTGRALETPVTATRPGAQPVTPPSRHIPAQPASQAGTMQVEPTPSEPTTPEPEPTDVTEPTDAQDRADAREPGADVRPTEEAGRGTGPDVDRPDADQAGREDYRDEGRPGADRPQRAVPGGARSDAAEGQAVEPDGGGPAEAELAAGRRALNHARVAGNPRRIFARARLEAAILDAQQQFPDAFQSLNDQISDLAAALAEQGEYVVEGSTHFGGPIPREVTDHFESRVDRMNLRRIVRGNVPGGMAEDFVSWLGEHFGDGYATFNQLVRELLAGRRGQIERVARAVQDQPEVAGPDGALAGALWEHLPSKQADRPDQELVDLSRLPAGARWEIFRAPAFIEADENGDRWLVYGNAELPADMLDQVPVDADSLAVDPDAALPDPRQAEPQADEAARAPRPEDIADDDIPFASRRRAGATTPREIDAAQQAWARHGVRSVWFRRWFGDWVNARRLRNHHGPVTVVEASGEEVSTPSDPAAARDRLERWARDNVRGRHPNLDTGWTIRVSREGLDESFSHADDPDSPKLLVKLPELIRHSVLVATEPHVPYDRNLPSVHHLYAPARVAGRLRMARLVVKQTNVGSKLYDVISSRIEEPDVDLGRGSPEVAGSPPPSGSTMSVSALLARVKPEHRVSRVVDERGEPMVVYHGTPGARFSRFDTGATPRGALSERRRGTFYFTDAPSAADTYAASDQDVISNLEAPDTSGIYAEARWWDRAAEDWRFERNLESRNIPDNAEYQAMTADGRFIENSVAATPEQAIEKGKRNITSRPFGLSSSGFPAEAGVLPAYLKLINPLVIDAQGGLWRGRVGRAVDDARSQGRDGVIIRNIRDSASSYATPNTTYIAFDEGQIKSALGNRGTYDPAEQDMTFASRRIEKPAGASGGSAREGRSPTQPAAGSSTDIIDRPGPESNRNRGFASRRDQQGQQGLYGQGTVSGIGARQGDLFGPGSVNQPTPMPADAERFGLTPADVQMAAAYSDGEPTAAFAYGVKRRREGKAQPITSDDQERLTPSEQRQARDGYRAADQFASNLTQADREQAEQRAGDDETGRLFASRRRPDGTLPIEPKTDLDPQQAQVQRELIEVVNDRTRADRAYDRLNDSYGGKVIGTDIARFLHPVYHSRRGRMRHTPSTSRPASVYAEDRLARELENPPAPRPGYTAPQFLMTAGGVASGKSTVITDEVVKAADLISDGQMKNPAKAIATIERALRNGWQVTVHYVHRLFDDAAAGAVQRGISSGRWGPLAELPALHMAAQRAAVAVARHFADDPRVTVRAWRNETGRQPVEIPVNALAEGGDARYTNVGELDATVQRQLDSQRPAPDADQLTHQLYQLIAQPAGPGLGPDQSQVDRLRAASGERGASQSDAQGLGQPADGGGGSPAPGAVESPRQEGPYRRSRSEDLNPPDNRFASRRRRFVRDSKRATRAQQANQRRIDRAGQKLIDRIKNDPRGQKAGMGAITDYLADAVEVEIREGLSGTTERDPSAYLGPAYHLVRSRARGSDEALHRVGVAIGYYLQDHVPEALAHMDTHLKRLASGSALKLPATPEAGFGEFVRRWVTDPDSLPGNITQPLLMRAKIHTPHLFLALDHAREAYTHHEQRGPVAVMQSYSNDMAPKEPTARRWQRGWHQFLFSVIASGSALETRVRKPVIKSLRRVGDRLVREFERRWRDSPADIISAHQSTIHLPQEVQASIYGTDKGQQGLRIPATAEAFDNLTAEDQLTLLNAGFDIGAFEGDGRRRHGEYLYLTDYTIGDVIEAVGEADWETFEFYGWARAALARYQREGHLYPGFRDALSVDKLTREIQRLDEQHPDWRQQFDRINRYMDQLLLVSVLSGELTAEQAVRIKRKWGHDETTAAEGGMFEAGYWPLPRRFGRPIHRRSGAGAEPDAGIERAFGSQAPFAHLLEAIDARVYQALEAYHANRVILAVQAFTQTAADLPGVPIEVRGEIRRILAPLPLRWEAVAELEPAEMRKVIADYLNEQTARELGLEDPGQLPAEQRADPEAIEVNFPGEQVWRQKAPRGRQIVAPWRNGKREFYEVKDPVLFNYFTRSAIPLDPVRQGARWVARMMRDLRAPWARLKTHNIGFAVWNLLARDPSTAQMLADDKYALIPGGHAMLGLWNRVAKEYPEVRISAELLSKAYSATTSRAHRNAVERFLDVLREGVEVPGWSHLTWGQRFQKLPGQVLSGVTKPLDLAYYLTGMRWFAEQSETLSREGAYVAARRAGMSPERAQAAYDFVTGNFGERPGDRMISDWIKSAGFTNPGFQIVWQTYQKMTDPVQPRPLRAGVGISTYFAGKMIYLGTLYALASAMYHLMLDDDDLERLGRRTDEDRLRYMHWKVPFTRDAYVRMPFDYGPAGGAASAGWNAVADRFYDNPIEARKMATFLVSRAADTPWVFDILGPQLTTFLELKTNYSTFFDSKIVPPWLSETYEQTPELQYTEDTPHTYRFLGELIGESPIKIEYALRNLLSNEYHDVIAGVEDLIAGKRPSELSELPIVGRLFGREPRGWRSKPLQELIEDEQQFQANQKRLRDEIERLEPDYDRLEALHERLERLRPIHELFLDVRRLSKRIREAERNQVDPQTIREMEREMTGMVERAREQLKPRTSEQGD